MVGQEFNYPANNDIESWNAISIKYKLNKRWSFNGQQQLRLNDSIAKFQKSISQIESSYKLSKKYRINFGMRYVLLNDHDFEAIDLEHRFRYQYGINRKGRVGPIEIKQRWRFQKQYGEQYPSKYHRYKVSFAYKNKDWNIKPKYALEFFNHNQIGALNGWTKQRFTYGIEYKIDKQQSLYISYIHERETLIWNPEKLHILSLKYNYELKELDFKKE